MNLTQIQELLDDNKEYDVLLFVQIRRDWFHRDLLRYLESHASFRGNGNSPEFFFQAAKLEDALTYFSLRKDKEVWSQVNQLNKALQAVQYIHVIE